MARARTFAGASSSRLAALAASALVLGACGGGAPTADFSVRGAAVVVRSSAEFTRSADFPSRVESTIDAALAYWGGSWSDLDGRIVVFDGEPHVPCKGTSGAVGCYEAGQIRVSTRDGSATLPCVEETVLVHEIGHAVIGDPDHTDPRWMDFGPLLRQLQGRPGYGANGETPCQLFPSVWRHPPSL